MLEIVDENDKPFLLQSHNYAKNLAYRHVVLLIQDHKNKMLMWRNQSENSHYWDFLHDYVRVGEARENTFFRLIERHILALFRLMHQKDHAHILENIRRIHGKNLVALESTPDNHHSIQSHVSHEAELIKNKPTMGLDMHNTTFFILQLQKKEKALLGKDVLWLDFDELLGFATHFPDMLGDKASELLRHEYLQKMFNL